MEDLTPGEITRLATALRGAAGNEAIDRLFPVLYRELRALAGHYFREERVGHTLQPTALVHEAYLRLLQSELDDRLTRNHFFALTAQAMRRVLIDHARAKGRLRRGGDRERVNLDPDAAASWPVEQLEELSEALDRLAELDARQARIVELRFFSGLSVEEVAEVLDVSKRTVEADWTHARAWLKTELEPDEEA